VLSVEVPEKTDRAIETLDRMGQGGVVTVPVGLLGQDPARLAEVVDPIAQNELLDVRH
jgi:hypothetical protein